MFAAKIFVFSFFIITTSCGTHHPYLHRYDSNQIEHDDFEDRNFEKETESVHPIYLSRVRRQLRGLFSKNLDGSGNFNANLPLASNNHNALSAVGSLQGLTPGGGYRSAGGGLAFQNVNGHGLSLQGTHIPSFGNQLTAAGKLNLFHNDNHNLAANAFFTRNLPSNPNIPAFNTKGAGLDYMFKDKIGGSLGVANTDLFKKTDYSVMGNVNLFKGRDSSLDFNAGLTKSVSPFLPRTGWQPNAGLTFRQWF